MASGEIIYKVYIVECADKTLYTGYTTELKRRIEEHNTSKSGAKYTAPRRPVKLVYYESFATKSQAMKRESEIKRLTRKQKLELIRRFTPNSGESISLNSANIDNC